MISLTVRLLRKIKSACRRTFSKLSSFVNRIRKFIVVHYWRDPNFSFIDKINHLIPENDAEYRAYQAYYLSGLQEKVPVHLISERPNNPSQVESMFAHPYATHVGQYQIVLKDGRAIKMAIDAHDHRNIRSQECLAWSDLYFKSNKWPSINYDEKCLSIVNGNGDLSEEKLRLLKSLRNKDKLYDFIFVSRIWTGGDANVEHNLRLFEKLARVNAKSKLLAVFVGFGESDPDFISYRNRLDAAGVPWTFDHMDYRQLMSLSAQSRCVIVRAGISSCIPWRMLDLLCLGACVVVDNIPFPEWPIPLTNNKNYLSLNLRIHPEARAAPIEDYKDITEKMDRFLNDPFLQQTIRENNCAYFDNNAHPVKIAEYIAGTCLQKILSPL